MASGVDAARQVANLVLLENQFSALPSVLDEGEESSIILPAQGRSVLVPSAFLHLDHYGEHCYRGPLILLNRSNLRSSMLVL